MSNPLDGLITTQDIVDFAEGEKLILDDADRIGVLEASQSIDVQACPGSGKTTLIAAKLMLLAKKWPFQDRGICVLSHTNVAKDEIIRRLQKSNIIEAQSLLVYPHFIGTIQEFVNRFLALPALRSRGIKDITVDNDAYVKVANTLLERDEFVWLRGTLNGLGSAENIDGFLRSTFRYCVNGYTEVHISKKPKAWSRPAYLERAKRDLNRLKSYLDGQGFYLFRDMYTQAEIALRQSQGLSKAVSSRFPCLFLDEMQDTQKFQDDLLRVIFPSDNTNLSVQRFGDPDQAIFHGIGSEEPNESFNGKTEDDMDFVIDKSHRFSANISGKIAKFSFNSIELESELSEKHLEERKLLHAHGSEFENTIIIFDNESITKVIPTFLDVVSQQFSDEHIRSDDFTVKIIGAVGKETVEDDQLTIGHYWTDYNKAKSVKKFRENTLIEAVRLCRERSRSHLNWAENYKLLIDCFLRLLRNAGVRDPSDSYFNTRTLREHLVQNGGWKNFREFIHLCLNPTRELDAIFWSNSISALCVNININSTINPARDYLAFSEPVVAGADADDLEENADVGLVSLPDNAIRHPRGFRVELSTIHGVKGETHDATLVLETKFYCYDLGEMVRYLTGELPSAANPNSALRSTPHATVAFKPNQKFMRQFYVAMSRPKHLLGLAVHVDRITEPQRTALSRAGWRVNDLTQAAG
ncbi:MULTISPECIES: UvrD-helicase domain-containing protein [Thalassospira]|uniref:UvrD-helicase domain-containing protein n=1 Tax=Thalassospira TaxID=168934 RepID=UPI0008DD9F4A|nr:MULTISPECIES: UvrD-helicase domain-containing protein [Thalassospira]MDM7978679.1 UvrD-helicase domain-containing protein [Thalassospira xiamenensis]